MVFQSIAKKFFVLVLAVTMMVSLLPGCSSKVTKDSPVPSADSVSANGEKEHKLKILGKDRRDNLILVKDREEYPVWQALENFLKDTGNITLDFELVPKEQYPTVIQSRMAAANDLPDIVNLNDLTDDEVVKFGEVGSIIDVKAAIDQYSNGNTRKMWAKYWPDVEKRNETSDGKMYWYPGLSYSLLDGEALPGTHFGVRYRYDWMQKLGLEPPKTTDDLFNLLKAFQDRDANGSSQKDEIAVISIPHFENGIAQAFGLSNQIVGINEKEHKAVSPWYQPGVKDYILYMKKFVDEGLIDPSLLSASEEVQSNYVAQNNVSLNQSYLTDYWTSWALKTETAHYVGALIKNEKYEPAYLREPASLVYMKFAITKNCKDVEGAVRLFDCIYTDEYALMSMYGVEDVTFKVEDGRKLLLVPTGEEEIVKTKLVQGHSLYGHAVLPVVNIQENWRDENEGFGITKEMQAVDDACMDKNNIFSTTPQLALPTTEELEIINKDTTALTTYSEELLTNLILGRESMNDWDTYMAKLKELGLDRQIEIAQARHDRYMK